MRFVVVLSCPGVAGVAASLFQAVATFGLRTNRTFHVTLCLHTGAAAALGH